MLNYKKREDKIREEGNRPFPIKIVENFKEAANYQIQYHKDHGPGPEPWGVSQQEQYLKNSLNVFEIMDKNLSHAQDAKHYAEIVRINNKEIQELKNIIEEVYNLVEEARDIAIKEVIKQQEYNVNARYGIWESERKRAVVEYNVFIKNILSKQEELCLKIKQVLPTKEKAIVDKEHNILNTDNFFEEEEEKKKILYGIYDNYGNYDNFNYNCLTEVSDALVEIEKNKYIAPTYGGASIKVKTKNKRLKRNNKRQISQKKKQRKKRRSLKTKKKSYQKRIQKKQSKIRKKKTANK